MRLISSLILIALIGQATAWWGKGHLLVARMAYDILSDVSPDTVTQVEKILAVLQKSDPSWTTKEDKHSFVECTTFADDIKYKGGGYQSPWHFIDTPFLDEGGKISDYDFVADTHNITEALTNLVMWFKKEPGYNKTYTYQQISEHGLKNHTENDALSTAMRLLIHYCGDIHQPLHATSRVDHEYPKGDFGGNAVPIPEKEGAKNLHSVWDSVIYEFPGYSDLPFSDADWKTNGDAAKTLMANYKIDNATANNLNTTSWATESYQIGESFVYKGVKEDTALTKTYTTQARSIAEKRVVIAGHRLANLLISLNLKENIVYEPTQGEKLQQKMDELKDKVNDKMNKFADNVNEKMDKFTDKVMSILQDKFKFMQ